ncbi:MAG: MFS transporter [Oscillatoriales cyanobacterium CG2_30_44_21]|nr:MAG: MFS transporter [Oscillatoriales cyanobacterium CG2_30_44_21]
MAIATPSNQVRWLQVWSLASVQGAISLTWIAYGIYLPKFIAEVFAYPTEQAQQFATILLVIEGAIAVIAEPLFGSLSDRWQRWYSSRMPMIVAGTIAATAIFIGLPSLVIFGGANDLTRLLLTSLAVLWAIAMSTFRSPVICLLASFAGATQLPLAASVLTLVGGFVASIKPLATKFILDLGAPATFAIASIVLLAGVAGLRSAMVHISKQLNPSSEQRLATISSFWLNLAIVMFVGAAIGLGIRLLTGEVLPRTIKAELVSLTGFSFEILLGSAFIVQALLALITGQLSKQIDNKRLMIFSLGGIVLGLIILSIGFSPIAAILLILLILFCLSAVNNGMVAFALTMVSPSLGGMTVGIFFGGLSGAIALFGYLIPKSALITTPNVILLNAVVFLSAGVAIAIGEKVAKNYLP